MQSRADFQSVRSTLDERTGRDLTCTYTIRLECCLRDWIRGSIMASVNLVTQWITIPVWSESWAGKNYGRAVSTCFDLCGFEFCSILCSFLQIWYSGYLLAVSRNTSRLVGEGSVSQYFCRLGKWLIFNLKVWKLILLSCRIYRRP